MRLSRAAGGIVWRDTPAGPRIAVVHRSRRGEWCLPLARLGAGETWLEAARRAVSHETGCAVQIGRFAGAKLYVARREPELVLHWTMRALGHGSPRSGGEVDEVAWLSRGKALARLDHGSDRRLLLRALKEDPFGAERSPRAPSPVDLDWLRARVVVHPDEPGIERPYLGLIARIVETDGRGERTGRG